MTGATPRGWWVLDLALVAGLAGLCGYAIHAGATGPLRVLAALPLVLVLPGWALVAGLFPAASSVPGGPGSDDPDGLRPLLPEGFELGGAERVGLSVALSVAVVPTVALAVDFGPWPIALRPVLAGVVATTLALDGVALVRRIRVSASHRYRLPVPGRRSAPVSAAHADELPDDGGGRLAGVNLALVASLLLLGASVTYALAAPPQAEGFTELYLETGDVSGAREYLYPAVLDEDRPTSLPVVVANREGHEQAYTVVALLQDATVGDGERVVHRAAELDRQRVTLGANETRDLRVEATPPFAGEDLRLVVLLYRGDPPADPSVATAYRALDLVVTVRPGDGAATVAEPQVAHSPPSRQANGLARNPPNALPATLRGGR